MRLKLMPCAFCGSNRVRFYRCHDDWGQYVAVSCDGCMAHGPALRSPIGCDDAITENMRKEAAGAWNDIWHQISAPPRAAMVVDSVPPDQRRRRRRSRGSSKATALVKVQAGSCAGLQVGAPMPGPANGQIYPDPHRSAP